jgi:hypothetical protein
MQQTMRVQQVAQVHLHIHLMVLQQVLVKI